MTETTVTPVRAAGHACCECISDASRQIDNLGRYTAVLERQLEDALVIAYSLHMENHGGAFITCGRYPCNQALLPRDGA